jgi:hypothetical protein
MALFFNTFLINSQMLNTSKEKERSMPLTMMNLRKR